MLQRIRDLIEKYRTKERFMVRVAFHFPKLGSEYQLIERAFDETCRDFGRAGITRDGGLPYVSHPLAVAVIVLEYCRQRDAAMICAALLHDNLEDLEQYGWTYEYIQNVYGVEVAELVWWNTKPALELFDGDRVERDKVHHERLRRAPRLAVCIKLSDRLHNLMTLKVHTLERQQRKIAETYDHYLHYAEQHTILIHELEFVLKEAKSNLKYT
jgi:(p)ppGpp synthase/HD superfamily hydrolase